ncbi:MAG: DUF819 family protein [Psychrilyobacter sp.]|uniref:DUF819 family protein n=1 Tax=Psychrilyobacter sp. TaxID=2586924 RepID=UPI003C761157
MVKDTTLVWAVIAMVIAISFYLQKFKALKLVGPSIICILFGIILGNTGIMPHMHPVYITIMTYTIPISLSMFMLNMNIKEIFSLSKEPLLAVLLALISVCGVAFIASFLFHGKIPELYKFTGMFIGTYTGGSANLTAVGIALGATASQFATANGADYITGMPVLISFFILPGIILRSDLGRKIFPYSLTKEELHSEEDGELFGDKQWSVTDLAMLFGIALLLTVLSNYISTFFPKQLTAAIKIITITTLSIILGQFKGVQKIKGNTEVGIYVSAFFLVVIGFLVDIPQFISSVPFIAVYCATIILGATTIYIILCRIFKIKYQYAIIAFVAMIADGSSAAIISASNKWKSLVQVAILLGTIGGVAGNYLGIGLALLVQKLTTGG